MNGFEVNIKKVIVGHNGTSAASGWEKIYDGPLIEGDPIIEGQIETPGKVSIDRFQKLYLPVIKRHFGDESLRVLELGAGLGNATYGTIESLHPDLHIASEPFVSLLSTLRSNLDSWGYEWPRGIVAAYDANQKINLMPKSVNLILGNSVLHHILHWKECLSDLSGILDNRGMMLFGEPNYESWGYIITLIRAFLLQHKQCVTNDVTGGSSKNASLSKKSFENLERFARNLEIRFKRKDDVAFLEKLEDKHLFSIPALAEFADAHDMYFHVENRQGDFNKTFIGKIRPLLNSNLEVNLVEDFVNHVVPSGISDCILGEPFMIFSFHKA